MIGRTDNWLLRTPYAHSCTAVLHVLHESVAIQAGRERRVSLLVDKECPLSYITPWICFLQVETLDVGSNGKRKAIADIKLKEFEGAKGKKVSLQNRRLRPNNLWNLFQEATAAAADITKRSVRGTRGSVRTKIPYNNWNMLIFNKILCADNHDAHAL